MSGSDKIKVIEMNPAKREGTLKAFCKIQIGGITIDGFRIVQQPGQAAWLAPPQREWTDAEGKRRYVPLVEMTANLKKLVEGVALDAWQGTKGTKGRENLFDDDAESRVGSGSEGDFDDPYPRKRF